MSSQEQMLESLDQRLSALEEAIDELAVPGPGYQSIIAQQDMLESLRMRMRAVEKEIDALTERLKRFELESSEQKQ